MRDTIIGRHAKKGADERARDVAAEYWSDWYRPGGGRHTAAAVRMRRLHQLGYGDPDTGCPCDTCVDYRAKRAARFGRAS